MIQYYNLTGINPIAERIKLYKTFVVADPLPVVIKNHAQQRIVIKEKRLQGVPTMVAFVDEIISIPGVEVKSINI
jgi:hypothetical protein